jgi:hypothetical protein
MKRAPAGLPNLLPSAGAERYLFGLTHYRSPFLAERRRRPHDPDIRIQ